MEAKEVLKYNKIGNLWLGRFNRNGFGSFDTEKGPSELSIYLDSFPFVLEYSVEGNGIEAFGDTLSCVLSKTEETASGLKAVYITLDKYVEITVIQTYHKEGVISQTTTAKNLSNATLCIKQLYNFIGGMDTACFNDDYSKRVDLGIIKGEWCGEGQVYWVKPEEIGLTRTSEHNTRCTGEFSSAATYTTRKFFPMLFIKDNVTDKVWFFQQFPEGPYVFEVGLTDVERIQGSMYNVGIGTGCDYKHGFRVYLKNGESYENPKTVFGCSDKGMEGAMQLLSAYRRNNAKQNKKMPLMFNDYMNCLWGLLDEKECIDLMDAAKYVGAEGYCFDDGWFRLKDVHGFTNLGDWEACDERFEGHTFQQMIDEIKNRELIAGLWTELEVCSNMSKAASFPKDWFLQNDGNRIFRCSRFYFNFAKKEVRDYITSRLQYIYDLGIRYIKNDYNGHPGCGCDWPNASPYAGIEQHVKCVQEYFLEIREKFPDLFIESCASGGMRGDGKTVSVFDIQSISDCENYDRMPSILNGVLLHLLPEQIGIWAYPYPRQFWDMNDNSYFTPEYIESMKDGRETIFTMITSMLGTMYLSGKIDKADKYNLDLIKQAIEIYKPLREFIRESSPIYPLGFAHILKNDRFAAQGLKKDNEILLAVWRLKTSESSVIIPINNIACIEEIYPKQNFKLKVNNEGLIIDFTQQNQAVLLKIKLA